jgi:hypothetical protein
MRFIAAPLLLLAAPAFAAPVNWADWQTATTGPSGTATGTFMTAGGPVAIDYQGEVAFFQNGVTGSLANYFVQRTPPPYTSALVDNAPPAAEMIALSQATSKTLSFSQPVDNLFFAVVSLNGNGYEFSQDFEVVSGGCGFWGCGTLTKQDMGNGKFRAVANGPEPHAVIRFTGSVSSITWTSLTNEYWNGFTVGTYGLAAPVPEPAALALWLAGLAGVGFAARRRR